ncbi:MAG: sulfotransferase domain-containing protein [Pseudomonadota bacterium]
MDEDKRAPKNIANALLRAIGSIHLSGDKPDVVLLSTPRSGSTWLFEMITAEPGVRPCNEPLNIRKSIIARKLGISSWEELAAPESRGEVKRYLERISHGKLGYKFKTPRPFDRGYNLISNRVAFKILFGLEREIQWIKDELGCQIVCLTRHPLPVSLSREVHPRLESLCRVMSPTFSIEQSSLVEDILQSDDQLRKAVLDWTLQNLPLQQAFDSVDLFVTYEQIVLQPAYVVEELVGVLGLRDTDKISASMTKLSGSVAKSSSASLEMLKDREHDKYALLEKWRPSVCEEQEQSLMSILELFGVDLYRTASVLPDPRYWLGDNYPVDSIHSTNS